jgi:hypothetical protein
MSSPEFDRDETWSRARFDQLLAPVLRAKAHKGQVVFLDIASPIAEMLQLRAHVDAIVQTPDGGTLSLEYKIVRWPQTDGLFNKTHYRDASLETQWCGNPGHEQPGWMHTSIADVLLWCQCSQNEDELKCFPFHFPRLQKWFFPQEADFPLRVVPNPLGGIRQNGTVRLTPLWRMCRELNSEPFLVREGGLVVDLFGEPLLDFLRDPRSTGFRRPGDLFDNLR